MAVKNIILDLGVVLLHVDTAKTISAFKNLGIKDFDEYYTLKKQQYFFDEFEKGYLTAQKFRQAIKDASGINLPDQQIDNAWNAMLGEMPPHRFQLLQQLKEKYKLFLLSNTNIIHWQAFIKYFDETYGTGNFENLFEGVYYSFETGMRKPDMEIYELVLEENFLNPHETIFVDDNEQNILGATLTGIHSHLHLPETDIEKYFHVLVNNYNNIN